MTVHRAAAVAKRQTRWTQNPLPEACGFDSHPPHLIDPFTPAIIRPPVDAAARLDVIRELCSFEGRARRHRRRAAGGELARRLACATAGGAPRSSPSYVHPRYGLVHAAHCALGLAGSLLATVQPAVGFAIVLAPRVSMYLDLNYRVHLLRRLFFRRASQNVVAPGSAPTPPRA